MSNVHETFAGKKAQVTVFIVVAVVLLFGSIIFFYVTQQREEIIEPGVNLVQEQVPFEFSPIQGYANDCAYSVALEGLRLIGKQGGYISLTDKSMSTETFIFAQNPTESDAVLFTRDSELKVPYWWYLKSSNDCADDCKFTSKRPDLRDTENSIEKQLERYVTAKYSECINNFEPFTEQGYKITQQRNPKADIVITPEDISVLIDHPITVEKGGTKTDMKQFFATVPVNLEKIYDLATKVTNLQIQHHFIEKHALNLLVAFSGVDKNKLPPMADMKFSFSSTLSWQKSDIKQKITGLLASYIPLFQVDGTYNYERNIFDSELKQRLYDSTILPVADSPFQNFAASFAYLDFWPIYLNMNCKGEKCAPSSVNSVINFMGIQSYRFNYDLSFPVLVELEDKLALNGQGYTFNLFLEGNIRNNRYMDAKFTPLETLSLSEKSQLCDVRTSGNITLEIVDAVSKKPVEDVQILYTLTDESCFIGPTSSDGKLKEQFPVGLGGAINFMRDGYIGKAVEYDAEPGNEKKLRIELQPIYTKELVVRKKNIVRTLQGWQFDDNAVDLSEKEFATVTLTRSGPEGELEFSTASGYQGQQSEATEIELASGSYVASIDLLLNDRIIIPGKRKCVSKIFSKECFDIPKVDFGEGIEDSNLAEYNFPSGGLKLNLTIGKEDLEKSKKIVLYALNIDIAGIPEDQRVIEDLDQIGKVEEYSSIYELALQPAFE